MPLCDLSTDIHSDDFRVLHKFDEVAERRWIFKIETVGDCYVFARYTHSCTDFRRKVVAKRSSPFEVAGPPDPSTDHAVVLARFAKDILRELAVVTHELETQLGPGTGSRTMLV